MADGGARRLDQDNGESFRAHRAAFFFKLGRELEKVGYEGVPWCNLNGDS
jgi:hypothetical protein